jgi:hypothetical protein
MKLRAVSACSVLFGLALAEQPTRSGSFALLIQEQKVEESPR